MKPDNIMAGRKVTTSVIWLATNWLFVTDEMTRPIPKRNQKIEHRHHDQDRDRASERNSKKEFAAQYRERKADHSEREIRHDLPERSSPEWTGVTNSASKVPRSRFTRHHQRGQERTDQRHHEHDESRDKEMGALIRFVEPQPVLGDDRSVEERASPRDLPGKPDADGALCVAERDPRRIGVRPMNHHLNLRIAELDPAGEIGRDANDRVDLPWRAAAFQPRPWF